MLAKSKEAVRLRPKFFVQYIPTGKKELSLETAGGMVFDHKLLSIGQDTEGPALPPQTRPAIVAAESLP